MHAANTSIVVIPVPCAVRARTRAQSYFTARPTPRLDAGQLAWYKLPPPHCLRGHHRRITSRKAFSCCRSTCIPTPRLDIYTLRRGGAARHTRRVQRKPGPPIFSPRPRVPSSLVDRVEVGCAASAPHHRSIRLVCSLRSELQVFCPLFHSIPVLFCSGSEQQEQQHHPSWSWDIGDTR